MNSVATVNGFHDLVGQERAVRLLQRGLKTGRIAHAYLFTGPDGIGKKAAAIALALALNCQQGEAMEEGCGVCVSCRKIARGLHPDIQVIGPEGTALKIEQVRALEADAVLGPYEGKRKVFILESAEKLTEQAANALLKTLEEPPGWTVLVLLTTTPSALPPTIVSRCQTVIFSVIPDQTLQAFLVRRGVDQSRARLLVSFGRGSVSRALSLEVTSLASSRDLLLGELGRGFLDGPASLLDLAEKLAKDRGGLQQHLEMLSMWLRDLMVAKVSRRAEWLINQDRAEEVGRQAETMPLEAVVDGLRAVRVAMDGLARNANPRLTLEHLLLRLRDTAPSGLSGVSA